MFKSEVPNHQKDGDKIEGSSSLKGYKSKRE